MVPEIGGRSKNESMKFGFECLKRSFEVKKAIAVIQIVGRGLSMCQTLQDSSQMLCQQSYSSAPY